MEMHGPGLSCKQLRVIPAPPTDGKVQKEILLRNIDDLYGYRPGPSEPRVFYLNAWEFMMWWEVLPRGRYEEYVIPGSCYLLFPLLPGTEMLHEHWILHKRSRPMVPAPVRTRMPEPVSYTHLTLPTN